MSEATRASDETALAWLRLRRAGVSTPDIARHYGVIPARVRSVTNRVFDADVAESGEDLTGQYWGRT